MNDREDKEEEKRRRRRRKSLSLLVPLRMWGPLEISRYTYIYYNFFLEYLQFTYKTLHTSVLCTFLRGVGRRELHKYPIIVCIVGKAAASYVQNILQETL